MKDPCEICYGAHPNDDVEAGANYSAITIGRNTENHRMMARVWGRPALTIISEIWKPETGWTTVSAYKARYCPNCGRRLIRDGGGAE